MKEVYVEFGEWTPDAPPNANSGVEYIANIIPSTGGGYIVAGIRHRMRSIRQRLSTPLFSSLGGDL